MDHFRKIWDEDKHNWMKVNSKCGTRQEQYERFLLAFPEADDVSFTAFCNERVRCGAGTTTFAHGSTKALPIYSEHMKKGFVYIKVAQPSVWISKARWVYEQCHKDYIFNKNDKFIFLDGDKTNFSPENIGKINQKYMGIYSSMGGTVKGCPEINKLRIIQAELRSKQLDVLENLGMATAYGHYRVEKSKNNEKRNNYYQEHKEEMREKHRKYYEKNKEHICKLQRERRKKNKSS